MRKMQRPRLTLKVLFYAIFDVVGMIAFATGATWLARGQTLFFRDFPSGTAQAVLVLLAGIALMLWAAAQIVRSRNPPRTTMPTARTETPARSKLHVSFAL